MRILLPIGFVVTLLSVVAGSGTGCGGIALPPGAEAGSVSGAPADKCSADGTYWIVTVADCGFLNCPGLSTDPAYALCDGTSFSACTCTKPSSGSGWTEIPEGGPKDGGMFQDFDTFRPPHDAKHDTNTGEGGAESSSAEGATEAGTGETGSSDAAATDGGAAG